MNLNSNCFELRGKEKGIEKRRKRRRIETQPKTLNPAQTQNPAQPAAYTPCHGPTPPHLSLAHVSPNTGPACFSRSLAQHRAHPLSAPRSPAPR